MHPEDIEVNKRFAFTINRDLFLEVSPDFDGGKRK